MYHVWDRIETYTQFWSENLKEIDCLEDLGMEGTIVMAFLPSHVSRELRKLKIT
jgi:hypothetical protein